MTEILVSLAVKGSSPSVSHELVSKSWNGFRSFLEYPKAVFLKVCFRITWPTLYGNQFPVDGALVTKHACFCSGSDIELGSQAQAHLNKVYSCKEQYEQSSKLPIFFL